MSLEGSYGGGATGVPLGRDVVGVQDEKKKKEEKNLLLVSLLFMRPGTK